MPKRKSSKRDRLYDYGEDHPSFKHGYALRGRSRGGEYSALAHMIQRCSNPNNKKFPRYGGRGITVCEHWMEFANFLADMGERPSPRHSIDRKDNDGNYEPDNCRWATPKEQRNNTPDVHWVEYGGLCLTLAEWSERTGIRQKTLYLRRITKGWSAEQTLTRPLGRWATKNGHSV